MLQGKSATGSVLSDKIPGKGAQIASGSSGGASGDETVGVPPAAPEGIVGAEPVTATGPPAVSRLGGMKAALGSKATPGEGVRAVSADTKGCTAVKHSSTEEARAVWVCMIGCGVVDFLDRWSVCNRTRYERFVGSAMRSASTLRRRPQLRLVSVRCALHEPRWDDLHDEHLVTTLPVVAALCCPIGQPELHHAAMVFNAAKVRCRTCHCVLAWGSVSYRASLSSLNLWRCL